MSLEIIKQYISDTLQRGKNLEGNLIVENPRDHRHLFQPYITQYVELSQEDKFEIMNQFAGLAGVWDRIPITRKELPKGNYSRFVCSRRKKPKNDATLKKRAIENHFYACPFTIVLEHEHGTLTFKEHCQECLDNKEESADAIESILSVQKQLTSPTKV